MPHDLRPHPGASGRPTGPAVLPVPRPLEVWKFGGTSVADSTRLAAVASQLVEAHRSGRRVVAVLSAMGTTTTDLTEQARSVTDHPDPRELDALLSVGESVSCALAAMAVQDRGVRAVSLNAAQVGIVTDDHHANARLHHVRSERILAELDDDAVVLVTGFQGVAEGGDTTTLGRGGSDASAVAVAAALGVGHCTIFSDVTGVFTADPRLVPDARRLASLRHEEMLELAEGGAGVLQPRAVELAAAHDVDIHLRSSFTTEGGTWIRRETPALESIDVAGIAHRGHERLHTVTGVADTEVVSALAARGAAVGALSTREGDIRFTAPGADDAEVAAAMASIGAEPGGGEDVGTVSVVSSGIARRPEVPARALRILHDADIAVRLTTTTPGRVCVHVDAAEVGDAVRLLHAGFIGAAGTDADTSGSADVVAAGTVTR